jgi:O-antigen ligase
MIATFICNKSRHFVWQTIFYVLCALYLINIIGLLYTIDFKHGIKRLDTTAILVLFPVVFSMIQFTKKNVALLLHLFVWSVMVFCAFGLLSYATIVPELTVNMVFRDSKFYAPLLMLWPAHPHPSYLSTILLMAVPVALYLRYQDEKQITIVEMLLGVLLPVVFTVLSGARVGMVIAPVLLGLGYLFYCRFKPVFKWGLVVAVIVALGLLLHLYPKVDDHFDDPIRVDLRKAAVSAIREKPVFGWGTGSAKQLIHSEERAHSLGIEVPYDFNQFHNQYLEDMVQFGILGILILLLLFGWILWIGVSEKNYLLLSLLAIYMLFCWTEAALFVSKGVVPFTFWACFLVANRFALLTTKS